MNAYWVYMLKCSDGKHYVGVTNDITRRVDEHQHGTNPKSFTFKRRPVALVYSCQFEDIYEAIHWEKVLKNWNVRKKEALINMNEPALRTHAKKKFPKRYHRSCASLRSHFVRSTRHDIWKYLTYKK